MCFGSSDKDDAGPPPRPVQQLPLQSQHIPQPADPKKDSKSESKMSYQQQQQQDSASSSYAPPPGPPPSHQQAAQSYAPPPGPPPSHSRPDEYAPPPGPPPPSAGAAFDFAPPPGPPPTVGATSHFAPPPGPPPSANAASDFAPPPGPPPSHGQADQFAPPPGPPPSQKQRGEDFFATPPGPPPSKKKVDDDFFAPPSGPPPAASRPQEAWEAAVPDTALFPPPPAFFSGWDRSPAQNATEQEANMGEAWCRDNPLAAPITLDGAALEAMRAHNYRLMQPWGFGGKLTWRTHGVWECQTARGAPDSCIISYPPLYAVTLHSPLATGRTATAYYEVTIRSDSRPEEVSLALGFSALPYPNFRLPGWHRGSMAVHGDDGHKYINDRWGGQSFTEPFRRGETYGVGMRFEPRDGKIIVTCFFTREGHLTGEWDLHEEQDVDVNLPVTGLEGFHDLACSIGSFDFVSFDVVFDPSKWKYQPY